MVRGRKPRTWVKMDCEGILRGSINYLLPLDGQAVWMKMIAFSEVCGGRPGYIEDNNEKGLPMEYIAQELHCPLEILNLVIKKMGDDGALNVNGTGSVELVNFKHYQFSEYDRQLPYRKAKKEKEGKVVEGTKAIKECPQCHYTIEDTKLTANMEICPQCNKKGEEVRLVPKGGV